MEVIRVVTRVVHLVVRRQNIRHRHLGHPVKAAHLPLIREYNKVVTRIRVPIKIIRKINTYGRRQTRCPSKRNLINHTRQDRIILHMYRMSTGDTRVETYRRATLLDKTCTTDILVISRDLPAIPQERLPTRGVTAIHRDRRLIRPPCNSKR